MAQVRVECFEKQTCMEVIDIFALIYIRKVTGKIRPLIYLLVWGERSKAYCRKRKNTFSV